MYFQLKTKSIELEYMDNIMTVFHNNMYFIVHKHNILNIIKIVNNLYPGVIIDAFVHDGLLVTQDEECLYINNTLFIEDDLIPDLITIINQANSLIGGIYSVQKKPPKEPEVENVKSI